MVSSKRIVLFCIYIFIAIKFSDAQATVSGSRDWNDCDTWSSNIWHIEHIIDGVMMKDKQVRIPNLLEARSNYVDFSESSSAALTFSGASSVLTFANSGNSGGPTGCLLPGAVYDFTIAEAGHCIGNYDASLTPPINLGNRYNWNKSSNGQQTLFRIPTSGNYTVTYDHVHVSIGPGFDNACWLSDFDISIQFFSVSELSILTLKSDAAATYGSGNWWNSDGCGVASGSNHNQFHAKIDYTGDFTEGERLMFTWREVRHSAGDCSPFGTTRANVKVRRNS